MKKIIVQWVPTPNDKMYPEKMVVKKSNHERFIKGQRFDFGFLQIANSEGYTVEVRPLASVMKPVLASE